MLNVPNVSTKNKDLGLRVFMVSKPQYFELLGNPMSAAR